MPVDNIDDKEFDSTDASQIDPRDTYGSRFSVTSRRVASTSDTPRSAITHGSRYIRNSDKIFTKRHEKENLGGSVNIKNINLAKAKKLVTSEVEKITQKKQASKSLGLDSLFESTSIADDQKQSVEESTSDQTTEKIRMKSTDNTKEKYKAKGKNRPLKIIKPISFNSAKEISTALNSGAAVVLSLKSINEENAKRLLDFSFGAAAMCGAKVSLAADKTYVITIGPGLSQREKLLCVKEGIALKVEE